MIFYYNNNILKQTPIDPHAPRSSHPIQDTHRLLAAVHEAFRGLRLSCEDSQPAQGMRREKGQVHEGVQEN